MHINGSIPAENVQSVVEMGFGLPYDFFAVTSFVESYGLTAHTLSVPFEMTFLPVSLFSSQMRTVMFWRNLRVLCSKEGWTSQRWGSRPAALHDSTCLCFNWPCEQKKWTPLPHEHLIAKQLLEDFFFFAQDGGCYLHPNNYWEWLLFLQSVQTLKRSRMVVLWRDQRLNKGSIQS